MPGHDSFCGGCMCRAIRFRAETPPSWVGICHCSTCRHATGGALITAAGFTRSAVTFTGEAPATFQSSPGVLRSFCPHCGTSIAYQNEQWRDDIHLMLGAFDEPERLQPQFHIFTDHRIGWLHLNDDLPRYRTTPSAGLLERG